MARSAFLLSRVGVAPGWFSRKLRTLCSSALSCALSLRSTSAVRNASASCARSSSQACPTARSCLRSSLLACL
eukprot:930439-Pleurochrysis_carterae.AAC.2